MSMALYVSVNVKMLCIKVNLFRLYDQDKSTKKKQSLFYAPLVALPLYIYI